MRLSVAEENCLEKILGKLCREKPILFADCKIARENDLPSVNDVSDKVHTRMGLFTVEEDGKEFNFDGGTAMTRDGKISWTIVRGDVDFFCEKEDYDFEEVKEKILNILDK